MQPSSEEQRIEQIVAKLNRHVNNLHESIVWGKGKIEAWETQGFDNFDNERFLTILESLDIYLGEIRDSLASLLSWNRRIQTESKQYQELLLKLLGLNPDASGQEIADAVDDVSEVIAGYRRKKRGV